MPFIRYIAFVWGIFWRATILALFTAVSVGVGLGILSGLQSWPPGQIEVVAGIVGTPLTLLAIGFVVFDRIKRTVQKAA